MSSKCKCTGCETQRYYDGVRSGSQETRYELTITSYDGKTNVRHYKSLDYYEYYNIISEYFNVDLEPEDLTGGCECEGHCG